MSGLVFGSDHADLNGLGEPVDAGAGAGGFHGIIGGAAVMRRLFDQIRLVARCTAPVLIVGETGTGKELIARAIHERGARRHRAYVPVNCAALPGDLVESELFGHRRGAFSGALTEHLGLLRTACGGTMLLDEITEMSPGLQAKLLRVLQERTVRPVGGLSETPVDVRFLASTNRAVDTLVRDGHLRADLYYRLAVSVLTVPPLRDRADDLPALIAHHLAVLNHRYGLAGPVRRGLTQAALDVLLAHRWPGNVRELFNVLEQAFLSSPSTAIAATDLPELKSSGRWNPSFPPPPCPADAAEAATVALTERSLIERTLRATGGNKARAARQLGISRKTLYARLARYARAGRL